MRLLGVENLPVSAWLYLNMAVTGLGNPDACYVMIDEVQDYTPDQLAVMARFFRRAHFMLLGDPIRPFARKRHPTRRSARCSSAFAAPSRIVSF